MANTIDLTGDLPLVVPVKGATNWDEDMKTKTFQKLADHDHTSGKGSSIDKAAIAADAVDQTKILLDNDGFIEAKNNGGIAKNILKLDSSNIVQLGNGTENVKVTAGTQVEVDQPVKLDIVKSRSSLTATTGTASGLGTVGATEAFSIDYSLDRSGSMQAGTLTVLNGNIIDEFIGEDLGIAFSVSSGAISITNGGASATMRYIIKKLGA